MRIKPGGMRTSGADENNHRSGGRSQNDKQPSQAGNRVPSLKSPEAEPDQKKNGKDANAHMDQGKADIDDIGRRKGIEKDAGGGQKNYKSR